MGTLKNEKIYKCFNDCRMDGCPGHKMTSIIQTTSDVLIVDIDGKCWFASDPSQWDTLKEILAEHDYNQFDLSSPNENK